jgi:hypothetical protein
MRRTLAALATMACALLPATAGAATLHATPSTFDSVYNSAAGGDMVLLAAGAYGYFDNPGKTSLVTVRPEVDASVSMAGAQFIGQNFVKLQGIRFTVGVVFRDGAHDNVLDSDTFDGLGTATWEGRVSINVNAHHNTISNSHFGGGGCSDGLFLGNTASNTIRGNVFENIVQGSCGEHVDAIQFYGAALDNVLDGNLFANNTTGLIEYDGGSQRTVVTNNAFRNIARTDECLTISGARSPRVEHNTSVGGCTINFGSKAGQQTTNVTSRNNVTSSFTNTNTGAAPTYAVNDYNLAVNAQPAGAHSLRCTPTFVAGTSFTTVAGAAVASSSCGYQAGSDGLSMGVTVGGPPPPPPPDDHQPVAAFTYSPRAPVVSQTVTFDVSGSTCQDAPCSYGLTDEPGAWPIASGPGPTLTFAFQGAGTKHVTLRVTDVDGDVSPAVAHDVVVTDQPPPPPPPGDPTCDDVPECVQMRADLAKALDDLAAMTTSRDNVQALADAYKARAEAAEAKLAQIHTFSAP